MDEQGRDARDAIDAGDSQATDATALLDAGRRRFGTRGLAASGLLMTLACKPVLGAIRASPSGFLSVNQSRHGTNSGAWVHASGPDYWRTASSWPIDKTTKFAHIFSTNLVTIYGTLTLFEMVQGNKDDTDELGMYLTAALLSARSGWTDFLPETTILAMFLEWRTRGFYTPAANVQWNALEIVKYLKATMVSVGGSWKQQG